MTWLKAKLDWGGEGWRPSLVGTPHTEGRDSKWEGRVLIIEGEGGSAQPPTEAGSGHTEARWRPAQAQLEGSVATGRSRLCAAGATAAARAAHQVPQGRGPWLSGAPRTLLRAGH